MAAAASLHSLLRFEANQLVRIRVSFGRIHSSARRLLQKEKEEMDELQKNPFYAKYANKIASVQKTSPEEFLQRLSIVEENHKVSESSTNDVKGRDFSMPTPPKSAVKVGTQPSMMRDKKLEEIMKMELLDGKSKEEIGQIWTQHLSTKEGLCAVIPASTFRSMKDLYQVHKTFILPLPRKEGYEFVVVQFAGNEAHFTTLINFQAHSENAPECLTLVHFVDLIEDKGIVLMKGDFDPNVLSLSEAQCLANQVEMYFCNPNPAKRQLLETFTFQPNEFHHQDLISQIENISLLTEEKLTPSAAAARTSSSEKGHPEK